MTKFGLRLSLPPVSVSGLCLPSAKYLVLRIFNQDTLYSFGVWDLRSSPVTVTLPETGGRYMSLMLISQDHSIWAFYGPRTGTLTEEKVGSRYVFLAKQKSFQDRLFIADVFEDFSQAFFNRCKCLLYFITKSITSDLIA